MGASWSLVEHLHRTSFSAPRAPRSEMVSVIQAALQKDIHYELPANYMAGQGDTYFSGKMLAKLARILLLAHEFEGVKKSDFNDALGRLRAGVEIWYYYIEIFLNSYHYIPIYYYYYYYLIIYYMYIG